MLKCLNISKLNIKQTAPITIIAIVYKVKFSNKTIVVTAPGIPSCIHIADAGWPPVADGVMAEK